MILTLLLRGHPPAATDRDGILFIVLAGSFTKLATLPLKTDARHGEADFVPRPEERYPDGMRR